MLFLSPVPRCLHLCKMRFERVLSAPPLLFSTPKSRGSWEKEKKRRKISRRLACELLHEISLRMSANIDTTHSSLRFFILFSVTWKREEGERGGKKNPPLVSLSSLSFCKNTSRKILASEARGMLKEFCKCTQTSELNGYIWRSVQTDGHTLLCIPSKKTYM